jgi:hypothetical protein
LKRGKKKEGYNMAKGGAREGAGRPKGRVCASKTVTLPNTLWRFLIRGGSSASSVIRRLVQQEMEYEKGQAWVKGEGINNALIKLGWVPPEQALKIKHAVIQGDNLNIVCKDLQNPMCSNCTNASANRCCLNGQVDPLYGMKGCNWKGE